MKRTLLLFCALAFATSDVSFAIDAEPALFESTDVIRKYLAGNTKYNYTDFSLTRVSLEYIEDPAKPGRAYVYFFNHRDGGLRSGFTIYHFMDGTITEQTFGP